MKVVHVYLGSEDWMHNLGTNGDCFCEPECELVERRGVLVGRVIVHQELLAKKKRKKGMRAGMKPG